MDNDKLNYLKDILFHLELEGTYFYPDEEIKDDYFIAYRLIVIASDQDNEDFEFEIRDCLKSELSDENLIYTYVEQDNELVRIVGVPKIDYLEFENGVGIILEDTNILAAIEYLKNRETINFEDLISNNINDKKNFKSSKSFEIEELNLTKIEVEKTYHENGKINTELEVVNKMAHGLYKSYYDNGQLKVMIKFENGLQVDGLVNSYDEGGNLVRTVNVINGNKNGLFKEFFSSGNLKKEGEYKDDEIIGKPTEYSEDGSIKIDIMENKNSLPIWFKGELLSEGGIVTNPISGESYELNAEEFTIYHFIKKTEAIRENGSISDIEADQLVNALIWFVTNNPDAYQSLLHSEE
jgi:antitoxin component YwqK of YwqJK toxin-antitoxin module